MSTRILEYAGIAVGGALLLGGLVYFTKSPSSRYLEPTNLYNSYQTVQANRQGQRTMNNMMASAKADLNKSQNYIPQGTDPTQNIYGGKTRKNKKVKNHNKKHTSKTKPKNKKKSKI
jgi:hypothetical protein